MHSTPRTSRGTPASIRRRCASWSAYKSTDAHAYYDAYGNIVGDIVSYPVLGNPHYHQTHDHLETISQELVAR